MIAYLDSSVILRVVLRHPDPLGEWPSIERGVTSALAEVECLRTIDRLRMLGAIDLKASVTAWEAVYRVLEAIDVVELSPAVLRRASLPVPTPLGTLDALHLATAELWRQEKSSDLIMATHDAGPFSCSRSHGPRDPSPLRLEIPPPGTSHVTISDSPLVSPEMRWSTCSAAAYHQECPWILDCTRRSTTTSRATA